MPGLFDQHVIVKQGGALHNGISPSKKISIACEKIMIVKMLAQPGRTARSGAPRCRFARRRESPRICDDMSHPSAGVVVIPRCNRSRFLPRVLQKVCRKRVIEIAPQDRFEERYCLCPGSEAEMRLGLQKQGCRLLPELQIIVE